MDGEHHYFCYWSPSVNFCHDDIYAVAPVKGTIITLTTDFSDQFRKIIMC